MADCGCGIALRVQSTLACAAVEALSKVDPQQAERILRDANDHAARLRAACDRGDHGPQEKR